MTLSASDFAVKSPAVRLADGVVVASGGDVGLFLGVQLSLQAPADDELFCPKGVTATLAEIPSDEQVCPGTGSGLWTRRLFLSGAGPHVDADPSVVGSSALVRNVGGDALYRLRVLGDTVSLDSAGSLDNATATFEYEPVR